jgi:hypothetical protein
MLVAAAREMMVKTATTRDDGEDGDDERSN